MKAAAWLFAFLSLMPGAAGAERAWIEAGRGVEAWDGRTEVYLGLTATEIAGYAHASQWADEIQVSFELPRPELHGPWLVEYVAFYLSGGGTHRVMVRTTGSLGAEPGAAQAAGGEFTPLYSAWPPEGWTYVSLRTDPPCPTHLTGDEGDVITIGTDLLPGDAIGMAAAEAGIRGWGLYDGSWMDDSAGRQIMPAVRIGISDLGTSQANEATWGSIKDLFK